MTAASNRGEPGGSDEQSRLDLDRADAYGRSFADVYDHWYAEVTDADATARFVAARCEHGLVLELGVGSGRLGVPLAGLGCAVIGVDSSAAMLGQCRSGQTHAGGSGGASGWLSLVQADMRALPLRATFDAVLIAFNTLFNLANESEQATLLTDLASLLSPTGVIIIEALEASALLDGPEDSIGVRTVTDDGIVVTATQLDRIRQTMTGQHIEISDSALSLRPWRLRWLTPSQLDTLAADAGLSLAERHGDWHNSPFTEESETHISVYRRA